jgi:hypothetical protein
MPVLAWVVIKRELKAAGVFDKLPARARQVAYEAFRGTDKVRAQSAAVEDSLKTVKEAMYAAADRGDLAAKKVIDEVTRRPHPE